MKEGRPATPARLPLNTAAMYTYCYRPSTLRSARSAHALRQLGGYHTPRVIRAASYTGHHAASTGAPSALPQLHCLTYLNPSPPYSSNSLLLSSFSIYLIYGSAHMLTRTAGSSPHYRLPYTFYLYLPTTTLHGRDFMLRCAVVGLLPHTAAHAHSMWFFTWQWRGARRWLAGRDMLFLRRFTHVSRVACFGMPPPRTRRRPFTPHTHTTHAFTTHTHTLFTYTTGLFPLFLFLHVLRPFYTPTISGLFCCCCGLFSLLLPLYYLPPVLPPFCHHALFAHGLV